MLKVAEIPNMDKINGKSPTKQPGVLKQAEDGGKPVSITLMDIDHFKLINDTHGHGAGDDVLREFANRLQRYVRGVDLASRVGGEEFVVVMPDTDHAVGRSVAERLRAAVAEEAFDVASQASKISVTCSFGVATTLGGEDSRSLLERADAALYQAKRSGRNQVVSADLETEPKKAASL